jgi:hypothetical protein
MKKIVAFMAMVIILTVMWMGMVVLMAALSGVWL